MRNIYVLGANGQLGSDVVKVFDLHNVIPITRKEFSTEHIELSIARMHIAPGDVVINCIAMTNVDKCEEDVENAFKINSDLPKKLAQICEARDATLFHISTDFVFAGEAVRKKEDDRPMPINTYGLTKLASEEGVRSHLRRHFIFRTSALYGVAGCSGKGSNFVEKVIKEGYWGGPRVISERWTIPTHTLDVARAILRFIDKDIQDYGTYHCVSGGNGITWYEFATTIYSIMKIKIKVTPISEPDVPEKARRPKYSLLDNSKLSRIYEMPQWGTALQEYLSIRP